MTSCRPITRRKVALVEDDESMRQAIERLLAIAGHDPVAFVSAEELLAGGPGADTVCVVTDLTLPGRSGLELLSEMRRRGWNAPVVVITAYDTEGRRDEALRRGASAYLVKPFRGNDLLEAIRAALEPLEVP